MVRINLISPKQLSDQHLIAEYNEMLMLISYIKKYPSLGNIPKNFCLGLGHMRFFKDKILYLKKRHELIKDEMKNRGFRASKRLSTKGLSKGHLNDWTPKKQDLSIIRKRIAEKIKKKKGFYRYYGCYASQRMLIKLLG